MKLGKKAMTALAFAVGTCMFVSTAFADMALGTGYDRLKETVKYTAAQMEDGLDNYTVEWLAELKVDDETVMQVSTVKKYDTRKKAAEDLTVTKQFFGQTETSWSYFDSEAYIYKHGDDQYTVVERDARDSDEAYVFRSPFRDEAAEDLEKIVDALVGNLKEYVQVDENANGERVYSGTLTQLQVPALINAVSSFYMKQIINEQSRYHHDVPLPDIKKDIFVQKVTGTAVEDANGLLKSMRGEITFSGKDSRDVTHEVALHVMFKLKDVGTTAVVKPDLKGKKVEVSTANGLSDKYVGTYKANIVIEKDGEFVNIGERTLEIDSVQDGIIRGRYYETVKPEYASEYPEPYDFTFELSANDYFFTYKNPAGKEETGALHPGANGNIYLRFNVEVHDDGGYSTKAGERWFSGDLIRVFEE
ncbi:MAG: hypothetical protein A6D91_02615 [Bacillaceae bacterium G1]|nr:MAG: hypothetical protein A6D91_02615 [Bacillaceae bacterium G1]